MSGNFSFMDDTVIFQASYPWIRLNFMIFVIIWQFWWFVVKLYDKGRFFRLDQ